jgi:hypothetical protein
MRLGGALVGAEGVDQAVYLRKLPEPFHGELS